MSCTRHHHELSQSLDGRLPSGRREALLAHVDDCDACASLWDEMQRAQELALTLPEQSVSREFRDGLFDRIRSGEGTPDAVFSEPVPLTTKLMYVGIGAAAAALFLATLPLWTSGPAPVDGDGGRTTLITDNKDGDNNRPGGLRPDWDRMPSAHRPYQLQLADLEAKPFEPKYLAETSVTLCRTGVSELQGLTDQLDKRPLPELRAQLEAKVRRVKSVTSFVRWLEDRGSIQLPREFAGELRLVETTLGALETAEEPAEVKVAMRQLDRVDPQRMQLRLVDCCEDPDQFVRQFHENFPRRQGDEIMRALRIEVTSEPSEGLTPAAPNHRARVFFFVRR